MSKALKEIDINTSWYSITICRSFVRSHFQYGVINYDQPIMKVSIKNLKEFNTMLILQLQMPSKEHLRVNYVTN